MVYFNISNVKNKHGNTFFKRVNATLNFNIPLSFVFKSAKKDTYPTFLVCQIRDLLCFV